jgi:GGDEF domain-containing protein
LLEAGKLYRGMTKSKLAMLVEGLQPQVDQLAESLSLELSEERDYVQMLVEANRQMSTLGEQIAGESVAAAKEDQIYNDLLAHTNELTGAMRNFLHADAASEQDGKQWNGKHAAHNDDRFARDANTSDFSESKNDAELIRKLLAAANRCRERRQELSLLLLEPNVFDVHSDPKGEFASQQARESLDRACASLEPEKVVIVTIDGGRLAAILLDCERRGALAVANQAISELGKSTSHNNRDAYDPATTLSAGVATVSVVPRNFDANRMIESTARCLSAARACGISTVKSIEV